MKWVVLGDIGQRDYYHLGDEAMTEVAVEMLISRGAERVTLVAGDVETAVGSYGCPAVKRLGFRWGSTREACERYLFEISESLTIDGASTDLHAALRDADFALIAGGGNMNSIYFHLLYERVAFARIAKHHGVPVFITSQTVGPTLRDRDVELVTELVETAVCLGARESATAKLLSGLASEPQKVIHTFDDAVLLRSGEEDRKRLQGCDLGDRNIVASFAADLGTSGIQEIEYVEMITKLLDELAVCHNARVALVPHVGSLTGGQYTSDQSLNIRVEGLSRTGKLKAFPMLTAKQNLALLSNTIGSVSSRYHPLVFGPQAGVPTVGVSLSLYSSVRMRGALGNVGLAAYVVPSILWSLVDDAFDDALAKRGSSSCASAMSAEEYQNAWWDAVVNTARTGTWSGFDDLVVPEPSGSCADWSAKVEAATPVFERWGEDALKLSWANEELELLKDRLISAENRKVVRIVDRLAATFRRHN